MIINYINLLLSYLRGNMEYKIFKELEKYGFFAVQSTTILGNMRENSNVQEFLKKTNSGNLKVVKATQTHSSNILVVDENTDIDNLYNYDGFITNNKDFVFLAYYADCLPIFMIDKEKKIMALLHSGWRGTDKGIIKECINIFKNKYFSSLEDIVVVFGACISKNNYEIKEDLAMELKKKHNFDTMIIYKNNKIYLDLQEFNRQLALNEGILDKNIYKNNYCTYSDTEFYSYRRDNTDSRNMALIRMR